MSFGLYSKDRADAMARWYDAQQTGEEGPYFEEVHDTFEWYYVKLKQDLDAASDPLTGYTEATAQIVKYANTADNKDRELVTNANFDITVTNRGTDISASSGDYFWVREIGAEYVPFLGGGGGGGSQIGFVITDADCVPSAGTVYTELASIDRYTGCGDPPGVDDYTGEYEIEDYFNLMGDLTDEQLIGKKALAIYWNNNPACIPHWELLMVDWTGGC